MAKTDILHVFAIINPNAVTPFDPDDPTGNDEHFWVTSSRDPALHNYIAQRGDSIYFDADGDRFDPATSKVTDGEWGIGISDVHQGGGTTGGTTVIADPLLSHTQSALGWVPEGNPTAPLPDPNVGGIGPSGDATILLGAFLGVGVHIPNTYRQLAKTFTGLTPGATVTVELDCHQGKRTSPSPGFLEPGYGVRSRLQVTVDSGMSEALGAEWDSLVAPEPWKTLSVTTTIGASGTVRVAWGYYSVTGGYIVTGFEYDEVRITTVASPGLAAGRYVTLHLADPGTRQRSSESLTVKGQFHPDG